MDIEIVSTKKKLTKSLLSQMYLASLTQIKHGACLGFILNGIAKVHKIYLIKHLDEFYILPANYNKGVYSVWRRSGKGTITTRFENEEDCHVWWDAYQKIAKKCETHIYI